VGAPERGVVGIRYLAMTDDPDQRTVAGSINLRKQTRVSWQIKAALRLSTSKPIQIALNDISVSGFRAEWPNTLHHGDPLWLRLPGLAPLEARVVWSDQKWIGCRTRSGPREGVKPIKSYWGERP